MRYELPVGYGQVELNGMQLDLAGGSAELPGLILDGGDFEVCIPLIVFRQYGDVEVDVEILEIPSAPLGSQWQDVLELSVTAGETASISGWGGVGDTEIGLTEGVAYRVRYAVADADASEGVIDPPYPERYRVDFWAAPATPPSLVTANSGAGSYWNLQNDAREAGAIVNSTVAPDKKFRALVDTAFRQHPELRERIRAGRSEYVLGVLAYTQKIWPHTDSEPDPWVAPGAITAIALED